MPKQIIITDHAPAPIGPYSQAVLANNQLFVSGQVAIDPATNELIEGNIEYEYIDRITYHFLQVENWAFMVHSVNRSDPNSGWLISDIVRLPEQLKSQYKKSILYLD